MPHIVALADFLLVPSRRCTSDHKLKMPIIQLHQLTSTSAESQCSYPHLPPSALDTSHGGNGPWDEPPSSPPAAGAAIVAYGANTSSDENGGIGWMITQSSIVSWVNDPFLLHPYVPRLERAIHGGFCRHLHQQGLANGKLAIFPTQHHQFCSELSGIRWL